MSGLQAHVDEYLRLRRALGFKLKEDERTLGQLVAYLEAAGASTVSHRAGSPVGATARRGASEPVGEAAADRTWVRRLPADDRPHDRDPAAGHLSPPSSARHSVPVLTAGHLSPASGGGGLRHPMRAGELEALFGLLAVSGMRIGEAIALGREDVDLDAGVITIRKAGRASRRGSAIAPDLHRGVGAATRGRETGCARGRGRARSFSPAPHAVLGESVRKAFREIYDTRIGLRTAAVHPGSTISGIRRTAGLCALSGCLGW